MAKKMFYGGYFLLTKDGKLLDARMKKESDAYEIYEVM